MEFKVLNLQKTNINKHFNVKTKNLLALTDKDAKLKFSVYAPQGAASFFSNQQQYKINNFKDNSFLGNNLNLRKKIIFYKNNKLIISPLNRGLKIKWINKLSYFKFKQKMNILAQQKKGYNTSKFIKNQSNNGLDKIRVSADKAILLQKGKKSQKFFFIPISKLFSSLRNIKLGFIRFYKFPLNERNFRVLPKIMKKNRQFIKGIEVLNSYSQYLGLGLASLDCCIAYCLRSPAEHYTKKACFTSQPKEASKKINNLNSNQGEKENLNRHLITRLKLNAKALPSVLSEGIRLEKENFSSLTNVSASPAIIKTNNNKLVKPAAQLLITGKDLTNLHNNDLLYNIASLKNIKSNVAIASSDYSTRSLNLTKKLDLAFSASQSTELRENLLSKISLLAKENTSIMASFFALPIQKNEDARGMSNYNNSQSPK
jgi:hypothetical protein